MPQHSSILEPYIAQTAALSQLSIYIPYMLLLALDLCEGWEHASDSVVLVSVSIDISISITRRE